MKIRIPEDIVWIMRQISSCQEEVFLVGGCVRDLLLGRDVHDYDMTTGMHAEAMLDMFSKRSCKVLPTGLKHGTITVIHHHQAAEITTYRTEDAYERHRTPSKVQFTDNLKEDLKRRDFTINAMAYHPDYGLIDCFNAQKDLHNKIIRCVGDSDRRFNEDALRIMRALRFRCQLHFELHRDTQKSLIENSSLLAFISRERIRDEFSKLLLSDQTDLLQYLKSMQVLDYILPGIDKIYGFEQHSPWHLYDVFRHTDIALNHAQHASLRVKLALVLHDIGKPDVQTFKGGIAHYYGHAAISAETASEMLSSLRYPKRLIREVCLLIRYHDTRIHDRHGLRKILYAMENDFSMAEDLLTIQLCDDAAKVSEKVKEQKKRIFHTRELLHQMQREHDIFERKNLQVNGHDMLRLGFEKQEIGRVLDYLIKLVIKTPSSNTKEKLTAFAVSYKLRENICPQDDQTIDHRD